MRLIDADELKKCAIPCEIHNGALSDLCVPLYQIDNAPTVVPFEPDYVGAERLKARQRGYEDGYHNGMEIGKTLNPKIKQGEWIFDEKGYFYCGVCNHQPRDQYAYTNFCPNCGAKMKND